MLPLTQWGLPSQRDDLRWNADGSLDIFLQQDAPDASRVPNWLPAPRGELNLVMRLYWPERAVLEGRWIPPAVARAGAVSPTGSSVASNSSVQEPRTFFNSVWSW